MRKLFAFFFLMCLGSLTYAQEQTGSYYLNFKQLQSDSVAGSMTFTAKHHKNGTEMAFRTNRDAMQNSFAIRQVYAIKINDTLWINGKKQRTGNRYYKALTHGPFIAYKAPLENSKTVSIIVPVGIGFGIIGGVIAASIIAPQRHLYIFSLRTGNTRRLNYKYLEQRLLESKNTELLSTFKAEKDKKSSVILLKYISLLNEYLAANSVVPAN